MIFHHDLGPMLTLLQSCLCPSPSVLRHGRHGLFPGDFDIYREDLRDDKDRTDRSIETAPKTGAIRGSFSHNATSSLRIDLSLKPGAG